MVHHREPRTWWTCELRRCPNATLEPMLNGNTCRQGKFELGDNGATWTKPCWYSIESWLVNRDSCNGLLQSPYNWVGFHPLYTANNQGFGQFSIAQRSQRTYKPRSTFLPDISCTCRSQAWSRDDGFLVVRQPKAFRNHLQSYHETGKQGWFMLVLQNLGMLKLYESKSL